MTREARVKTVFRASKFDTSDFGYEKNEFLEKNVLPFIQKLHSSCKMIEDRQNFKDQYKTGYNLLKIYF
jgi:hypothetical protein